MYEHVSACLHFGACWATLFHRNGETVRSSNAVVFTRTAIESTL